MSKYVLEYVKNEDRTSSNGNAYVACSIKVKGKFYNGFGDEVTVNWKKGETVNVELYEEEYNGKLQSKFNRLEPDENDAKLNDLLQRVTNIEKFLKNNFMSGPGKLSSQKPDNSNLEKVQEVFPGSKDVTDEKLKKTDEPW